MTFYCLYDNLYEEYQLPFVMKNDNVAFQEFDIFLQSLIEKAKDESEKVKLKSRYYLCKYDSIKYDRESGIIESNPDRIVRPEAITAPEDDDE